MFSYKANLGLMRAAGLPTSSPASQALSGPAGAAILYAVAKGDIRRAQDFCRGPDRTGVIKPKQQ